jgi:hypothetical protein
MGLRGILRIDAVYRHIDLLTLLEHFEFFSENIGEKHVLFFTEIFTFFFSEKLK